MREVAFLKQNADKWKQFEELVGERNSVNPDTLADLYIELTDDLSYAKTFYPGSKTTKYLNNLTAKFHQALYRSKLEDKKRFKEFWTRDLPLIIKSHHKKLFYSLVIFTISICIGIISASGDRGFIRLILGDLYVKMTMENIAKGDPMAVYKSMNNVQMFLGITINNIMVAAIAFLMGIFISFGTGFILFRNGVMLGVFHYLFYKEGLLGTCLLSVWLHGTLEISAIIIAGGAGIIIGNSILFPGTYTRTQSFIKGAREGLLVLMGTVPLFIVAGLIEGFVTRYTEMPFLINIAIIIVSLVFIIFYFVIYPIYINKKEMSNVSGR